MGADAPYGLFELLHEGPDWSEDRSFTIAFESSLPSVSGDRLRPITTTTQAVPLQPNRRESAHQAAIRRSMELEAIVEKHRLRQEKEQAKKCRELRIRTKLRQKILRNSSSSKSRELHSH